ncbi:MAG: prolyl oligopeptidase family serine peptidase [Bryobacteraceae bacterium]
MPLTQIAFPAAPPESPVEIVTETLHGVQVADPYRWLEDQKSPRTRAWIEAQNRYRESMMSTLPAGEEIRKRLEELLRVEHFEIVAPAGGRVFYARRGAGSQLHSLFVRDGAGGSEQLLVDPEPMSPAHTTSVALYELSDDGKLMLYGVRQGGEDEMVMVWLDPAKNEQISRMPKARYLGVAIERGNRGLYYGVMKKEGPRVFRRRLDASGEDPLVFGDGIGPDSWITPLLSPDDRSLLLTVSRGWDRGELYLNRTGGKQSRHLTKGIEANFTPVVAGDQVFVLTNWKAPKGRVMAFHWKHPEIESWREVVPEGPDAIEEIAVGGGRLFVHAIESAKSRLRVYEPSGRRLPDVTFSADGTIRFIGGRWQEPDVYVAFTSFHIPTTIYRYTASGTTVWHEPSVKVDNSSIEMKQVWYKSKDGTKVPMFVVHKKGLQLDGTNPALLTGYGGFNQNLKPQFTSSVRVWVERGGIFAQANLRGGGEFGETWHQAGMLERKQNVFDDFIAAAEFLIARKYTSPEKLAIQGGSNGGLLVGAAMTQRPELFRAVICAVPLLDMVRYHRFLLAKLWVPEYGSADDPKQFEYIYKYSPYHHVKAGTKYPAVLFVTGDADTRVDPLHARKMTALMQASNGSGRPVVLRYDTTFGHTRSQPLDKTLTDVTHDLKFLMWQLEMP